MPPSLRMSPHGITNASGGRDFSAETEIATGEKDKGRSNPSIVDRLDPQMHGTRPLDPFLFGSTVLI